MTYVIMAQMGAILMRLVSDPARLHKRLEETGLLSLAADYPAVLYHCPAGRDIVRQGEPLTCLYVFLTGRAKVVRLMENGRTMLHAFYRGVSLLGDLELCRGDQVACTTVRAITDAWLIGFPLAGRRDAMLGDARFLKFLCVELAVKLEQASELAAQNLLVPLAERLVSYMREAQAGGVFRESLTSTAEILGVSYRHLLRTLASLEKGGAIRRVPGGYALHNGG